jgi:hypothetical protein
MLGEPHCLCVPLLQKVGGRTQSGMAAAGSGQPVFSAHGGLFLLHSADSPPAGLSLCCGKGSPTRGSLRPLHFEGVTVREGEETPVPPEWGLQPSPHSFSH